MLLNLEEHVCCSMLCGSPWNRCSTWCTPTRNPSEFKSGNAEIERAEWCNTWTKPPTDHHAPLQPGQDTSLVSTEEQQDPSLQISGLATCNLICQACGLTCMDYMDLSIFLCSYQFWILQIWLLRLRQCESCNDPVHMILYGKIHGVRRGRSQTLTIFTASQISALLWRMLR